MTRPLGIAALVLAVHPSSVEEKPWLELFQEVVVYRVAKRLQFKVRPDYRLIVSEMTVGR